MECANESAAPPRQRRGDEASLPPLSVFREREKLRPYTSRTRQQVLIENAIRHHPPHHLAGDTRHLPVAVFPEQLFAGVVPSEFIQQRDDVKVNIAHHSRSREL